MAKKSGMFTNVPNIELFVAQQLLHESYCTLDLHVVGEIFCANE